jgi:hypothetical protein
MKNIILILFAMAASTTIVSAQDNTNTDAREKLAIGGKLGANYSNIYDSNTKDFNANPKGGFAAGGFLSIPIGKYLGIQPEVLYSQRGFKGTGTYVASTYDLNRTLSYLDIPILFAFKPTRSLTILAGPQYSYLLKQRDEFSNSSMTVVQQQEFKNDNIRRNTFCLTGGLDFNFNNLVIGVRTGWDMTTNKGDGTSSTPRYKNVWLQGTIGFRIY